jgi:hypothetical protein
LPWEVIVPEPVNGRDPRRINLGDDVFTTGMFYQHLGTYRNAPIIRSGHVAALPNEPIAVDLGPPGKTREALVESYLVELHSQQGLSGSPVFVVEARDRNVMNIIRGQITWYTPRSKQPIYLLGLVTHHFGKEGKGVREKLGEDSAELNFGIAVVAPHYKIAEFFDSPKIREHEESLRQQKLKSMTAERDSGGS